MLKLVPVHTDTALVSPESGVRARPQAVLGRIAHVRAAAPESFDRDGLLASKIRIVDVERRGTELRVLFALGAQSLTDREKVVLRAVFEGATDSEIARRLSVTRQCVCGHVTHGLEKLGVDSRFLALQAWRCLKEFERGEHGQHRIALLKDDHDSFVSVRLEVPPRPAVEALMSVAETHVAWLVCDGLSNREIAEVRGSAERTVANQVGALFRKLQIARRTDLALILLDLEEKGVLERATV